MIFGIFHSGSGLGNQLHRYVATRVLALDKGYEFGMVAPELFKGKDFMSLDMGYKWDLGYVIKEPEGKVVPVQMGSLWEENTPYYNPEFNFIEDNTIIDGEFQDERYFGQHLEKINDWLRIDELPAKPQDKCVIGFRGGEFALYPDLFLTKEYWQEAIIEMLSINPEVQFEVQTDDPKLAKEFFPDFEVIHDVKYNWGAMRVAKYAIIANSSFYILPRLLLHHYRKDVLTIAPRYWARRNTKEWSMPQNYYKAFTYI